MPHHSLSSDRKVYSNLNDAVMKLASKVFVKMVSVITYSIIEPLVLDIVRPISSYLASCHVPVVTLCATALNLILLSLTFKTKKDVTKLLEQIETINSFILSFNFTLYKENWT